jgi:tetratricopeptide (TPR) repeat protein
MLLTVINDLNRKLNRLMKEPDNAGLYHSIGTILCQFKDWDNAERYLQRAYELRPWDRDILYNYAVTLYLRQKYREAVLVCRAGLKTDPKDPKLLEKLGDICYLQGEYEEAAKTYKILRKASDKVGLS